MRAFSNFIGRTKKQECSRYRSRVWDPQASNISQLNKPVLWPDPKAAVRKEHTVGRWLFVHTTGFLGQIRFRSLVVFMIFVAILRCH